MILNVHAGHNPAGMIACGAVGILNESVEDRAVKDRVIAQLQALGHTVYDCTCDNGTSQSDVLNKIVAKCNSHAVDLDVSIHFNAGGGTGTEVWVYPNGGAENYASAICSSISSLGFRNRGVKTSKDLFVLAKTKAPALLVECCFVDSVNDANAYNSDSMACAIVEGITGQRANVAPVPAPTPEPAQAEDGFLIKVKCNLNIRKGPGVEYDVVGCIKDQYKYTIVETAKASDGGTWGRLKSGAGWINISDKYVTRC